MFVKKRILIVLIFLGVLVTWGWKIYGIAASDILISYVSPTIVMVAISTFLLFADMHFGMYLKKTILYLAPATFGVYLIHTQPIFFNTILKDKFIWIVALHPLLIIFAVIVSATIIFVTCILIEKLRERLFKALKVRYKIEWVENTIRKECGKIFTVLHRRFR